MFFFLLINLILHTHRTYGAPNDYTKKVELDFSLASCKNITILWDYKWLDYPEFLIYRPKLIVDHFTITPVYSHRNHIQRYRENHNKRNLGSSYPQYQEIDLDSINLDKYDKVGDLDYYVSLDKQDHQPNSQNIYKNPNNLNKHLIYNTNNKQKNNPNYNANNQVNANNSPKNQVNQNKNPNNDQNYNKATNANSNPTKPNSNNQANYQSEINSNYRPDAENSNGKKQL